MYTVLPNTVMRQPPYLIHQSGRRMRRAHQTPLSHRSQEQRGTYDPRYQPCLPEATKTKTTWELNNNMSNKGLGIQSCNICSTCDTVIIKLTDQIGTDSDRNVVRTTAQHPSMSEELDIVPQDRGSHPWSPQHWTRKPSTSID